MTGTRESHMSQYSNGVKVWHKRNAEHPRVIHRTDGPAMIYPDGMNEWWQDGERHRTDGPAVIYPDGSMGWYIRGKEITEEVRKWIKKNNIDITTSSGKIRFKLVWA